MAVRTESGKIFQKRGLAVMDPFAPAGELFLSENPERCVFHTRNQQILAGQISPRQFQRPQYTRLPVCGREVRRKDEIRYRCKVRMRRAGPVRFLSFAHEPLSLEKCLRNVFVTSAVQPPDPYGDHVPLSALFGQND